MGVHVTDVFALLVGYLSCRTASDHPLPKSQDSIALTAAYSIWSLLCMTTHFSSSIVF